MDSTELRAMCRRIEDVEWKVVFVSPKDWEQLQWFDPDDYPFEFRPHPYVEDGTAIVVNKSLLDNPFDPVAEQTKIEDFTDEVIQLRGAVDG